MISWTNFAKSIIFATITAEVVLHYMERYRKYRKKNSGLMNEVMFFTDKGVVCKEHCYKMLSCDKKGCSSFNMRRLIQLLENARSSLDVCMYLITWGGVTDSIIRMHRKGVKVRIIIDADMADCSGAQVHVLRKYGIPVRMKKSPFLMHHKFAVINNQILVSGSCNWTMQALTGNWDNIIVTSEPNLVIPFSQHFSQLWKEFSEIDYTFIKH